MKTDPTVTIVVWCTPTGAPYDFSEEVDTGMTREQWDACPAETKERFALEQIAALVAKNIDTGWDELEC